MIKQGDFVLITTDKKGVFAGELVDHDKENERCILKNASMCIYWSSDIRGVLGLATIGITDECKITPVVREIYLNGITSVTLCTDDSKRSWLRK